MIAKDVYLALSMAPLRREKRMILALLIDESWTEPRTRAGIDEPVPVKLSPTEVARDLNLDRGNVGRHIREMEDGRIIVKSGDGYILNKHAHEWTDADGKPLLSPEDVAACAATMRPGRGHSNHGGCGHSNHATTTVPVVAATTGCGHSNHSGSAPHTPAMEARASEEFPERGVCVPPQVPLPASDPGHAPKPSPYREVAEQADRTFPTLGLGMQIMDNPCFSPEVFRLALDQMRTSRRRDWFYLMGICRRIERDALAPAPVVAPPTPSLQADPGKVARMAAEINARLGIGKESQRG